MLRAGRLANRVTIQVRNPDLSTHGLPQREWTDAANVWAEVITLSGDESVQARQVFATATSKITIRDPESLLTVHGGLSSKMRVKFGERIFNIGHIDRNDQSGEYVALICGEKAA